MKTTLSLKAVDLEHFARFRITEESLALHQVHRITDRDARNDYGIRWNGGDLSGILYPIFGADGQVKGYRIRRENPERKDGKPDHKYIQSVDLPHLYFELSSRRYLGDVTIPIIFCEAYSSALALACWCERTQQQYLIIATAGCWGWHGRIGKVENENGQRVDEKGASPDLAHIAFEKRETFILSDVNATSNTHVQRAVSAFTKELQGRGAIVRLPVLPEGNSVNGPDDYLAIHHDHDLITLLKEAKTATADDDVLNALAKLSPIEYDRQREDAAARLGIRISILDSEVLARRPKTEANSNNGGQTLLLNDPEPWSDPVDITEVLNEIQTTIHRFVIVSKSAEIAISLWIVHTFAHNAANVSPILAINSPEKRCGKTTLLELLTALVTRALPTANVTAATIFRGVEAFHPTLLIDEADTFINRDADELRGILNSGHRRSTAIVLRTVGDAYEVKAFSTWCPKAIAAIGKLPDTLQDRSIVISMRRRSPEEEVERLRFDRVSTELEPVRRKAARWSADNHSKLVMADPVMPNGIDDRAADNWRALLAIADAAGEDWFKLAKDAATELCGTRDDDDDSARTMLLSDIRMLFTDRNTDKLASTDIVSALGEMETRPWSEWKSGKPITARQLAKVLKPFEIEPDSVRIGEFTPKGYKLEQFKDAFSRYLPIPSATSATKNKQKELARSESATKTLNVADKKTDKSHAVNDVADVADNRVEAKEETL